MSTSWETGRKSGITMGFQWSACPAATVSLLQWTAGPARKSCCPGRGCTARCCCWTFAGAWTRVATGSARSWTGPPACCWTGSGGRHTGTEDHSQHRNPWDTSENTEDGKSLHFRSSPHRPPTWPVGRGWALGASVSGGRSRRWCQRRGAALGGRILPFLHTQSALKGPETKTW